jgi:Bacterial dnaA protein helix-turn-helix
MDKMINLRYSFTGDTTELFYSFTDPDAVMYLREKITEYAGLSLARICAASRKREYTRARYTYVYALWRYTGLTLKLMGEELGGRDHTTIIHTLNTVADFMDIHDPFFTDFIQGFIDNVDGVLKVKRLPRPRTARKFHT